MNVVVPLLSAPVVKKYSPMLFNKWFGKLFNNNALLKECMKLLLKMVLKQHKKLLNIFLAIKHLNGQMPVLQ